jgi:hypothetical protein
VDPAVVPTGCVVNFSWLAAAGEIANELLVALVRPLLVAVKV